MWIRSLHFKRLVQADNIHTSDNHEIYTLDNKMNKTILGVYGDRYQTDMVMCGIEEAIENEQLVYRMPPM